MADFEMADAVAQETTLKDLQEITEHDKEQLRSLLARKMKGLQQADLDKLPSIDDILGKEIIHPFPFAADDKCEFAATLAGILQLRGTAFDHLQKKLEKHEWDTNVLLAYFCSNIDKFYSFSFNRIMTRTRMQVDIVAIVTRKATPLQELYAWACVEADFEVTRFSAPGKNRTYYRNLFIHEYMRAPQDYKTYETKNKRENISKESKKVHQQVRDFLKTRGSGVSGIGALLRCYMKMVENKAGKENKGGDDEKALEQEVAAKKKKPRKRKGRPRSTRAVTAPANQGFRVEKKTSRMDSKQEEEIEDEEDKEVEWEDMDDVQDVLRIDKTPLLPLLDANVILAGLIAPMADVKYSESFVLELDFTGYDLNLNKLSLAVQSLQVEEEKHVKLGEKELEEALEFLDIDTETRSLLVGEGEQFMIMED